MTRSMLIIALAGLATPAAGLASPPHKAADRTVQAVAATEYLFLERGVFELVAAPGRITDIVLEPGETLVETNPIAAGDTARCCADNASGLAADDAAEPRPPYSEESDDANEN